MLKDGSPTRTDAELQAINTPIYLTTFTPPNLSRILSKRQHPQNRNIPLWRSLNYSIDEAATAFVTNDSTFSQPASVHAISFARSPTKIFAAFLALRTHTHTRTQNEASASSHNPFRSFHVQLTFHRVGRGIESAAFEPPPPPPPPLIKRTEGIDACTQRCVAVATTRFFILPDSITRQVGRETFPGLCVIAHTKAKP